MQYCTPMRSLELSRVAHKEDVTSNASKKLTFEGYLHADNTTPSLYSFISCFTAFTHVLFDLKEELLNWLPSDRGII